MLGLGLGLHKSVLLKVNLVLSLIKQFKTRVSLASGIFEAESCLNTLLTNLKTKNLLTKASLVVTPNAYKASTLYSVIPNTTLGDMNVVRSTTKTRTNSLGLVESLAINTPSIDYTDSTCPSILAEPQRTNILFQSNAFNNVFWTNSGINVTPNDIISPDGTLNGTKIAAISNGSPFIFQSGTFGINRSNSIYAKKGNNNFVFLSSQGFNNGASFNLNTGVVATVTAGVTASIKSLANGWYKCTINIPSSIANYPFLVTMGGISGGVTAGDYIYIYGAQLESGLYPTSYIPTTTTTVTRTADSISKSGISSLIGQTEGTIFLDLKDAYNGYIGLSDNSDANSVLLAFSKQYSSLNFYIYANSVDIIGTGFVALPSSPMKLAFKYKSGEIKLFVNGVLAYSNTSAFTFSSNLSFFGNGLYWGGGEFEGLINSEQLYKTALTDTECINLTTL